MSKDIQTSSETALENPGLLYAYAIGFFGILCFGATLPVTRIALLDFSPGFITFSRAGIAAVLAFVVLKFNRRKISHEQNFLIFLGGLFLIFGFPGLMAVAMQTVPASHGGVILSFIPLVVALLARMFAGELPSGRFWILSILGGLIVAGYTIFAADDSGNAGITIGDLWLIAAGFCAAAGYVIFGKLSRGTPGWEIVSRALVLNVPLVLPGIWWFYEPQFLSASKTGIIALIYLAIFSMLVGFFAWNVALARGGIARIGQLQLLQTFITIILAALIASERIDLMTIIAAIATTAIIALTRKS